MRFSVLVIWGVWSHAHAITRLKQSWGVGKTARLIQCTNTKTTLIECKSHSLITLLTHSRSVIFHTPLFFKRPALDFYIRCIKHQSTNENQNKMKIYKTLWELGQKTNEVRENTPCAKIPSTTLDQLSSYVVHLLKISSHTRQVASAHFMHPGLDRDSNSPSFSAYSLLSGITVLIQELNSLTRKRSTPCK